MDKNRNILVTQSSMPPMDEYINEISSLWETKWLTNMGSKHQQLQKNLVDYLGVDNVELLVNGHMAIEMGLQVCGFKPGSEVITTPFTFTSTTHAIVRNGLKPVFCDIKPSDYTIDTDKIEALITEKTVAIMPVHVYGNICDVKEIERIARKHGLMVLYDAAHSFGEKYKGVGVGNFGDMSFFSFHATKVFNTIEGGAVCFHDEKYRRALYDIKNFGIHGPEEVFAVGGNAKMNEFCASMGICNLRHVDGEIEKRKKVVEHYRSRLSDIEGLKLNIQQSEVEPNYAYFPVVFDPEVFGINRDEVQKRLGEHGIGSRKYFYPLTNSYNCYEWTFDTAETPVAKKVSDNVLCLPLYADLDLDDVDIICNIITKNSEK